MIKEYIFTFGCGQVHENYFHAIMAHSYERAREIMFDKFGHKWSMQYEPTETETAREAAGVEQFNLKEIK